MAGTLSASHLVTSAVTGAPYSPVQEADMVRNGALKLDFGDLPAPQGYRRGLRLAVSGVRGPEKYRVLALKRRRAQIRARRVLGLA